MHAQISFMQATHLRTAYWHENEEGKGGGAHADCFTPLEVGRVAITIRTWSQESVLQPSGHRCSGKATSSWRFEPKLDANQPFCARCSPSNSALRDMSLGLGPEFEVKTSRTSPQKLATIRHFSVFLYLKVFVSFGGQTLTLSLRHDWRCYLKRQVLEAGHLDSCREMISQTLPQRGGGGQTWGEVISQTRSPPNKNTTPQNPALARSPNQIPMKKLLERAWIIRSSS